MFDSLKEKMFGTKNSQKKAAIEKAAKFLAFLYIDIEKSTFPLSTKLIAKVEEGFEICRELINLLERDGDKNDLRDIERLGYLMESIDTLITIRDGTFGRDK